MSQKLKSVHLILKIVYKVWKKILYWEKFIILFKVNFFEKKSLNLKEGSFIFGKKFINFRKVQKSDKKFINFQKKFNFR